MILVIVALSFSAYFFMLGGPFKTLDDEVSIVNNPFIKDFSHLGKIFRSSFFTGDSYYRPLVSLSHMLEYHFFGLNPFVFNLTNLILHTTNAIGVFFLVFLIAADRWAAFFTSLLFAIHPIQWEAVANIAGRSILLCSFFYIGGFVFLCWSLLGEKTRIVPLGLSLVFFGLSLLCKESAVIFPLALLSFWFFTARNPESRFSLKPAEILPFAGIILGYVLLRQLLGITNIFYWGSPREFVLGVLTFLRSTLTHVKLLLWPVDLYFDRSQPVLKSFWSPETGLILAAATLGVALILKGKDQWGKEVWFFLSWFFISLLLVAQIVPVVTRYGWIATADHFLYLPSVGVFFVLVILVRCASEAAQKLRLISGSMFSFFVTGIFVFLFLLTVQQNLYANQEIAMFEQSLRFNPHNLRVRTSLGLALAKRKLFLEAEEQFRIVLAADPLNVRARIGLGKSLCDQGKFWEGITEYEKISEAGALQELLEDNLRLTYGIVRKRYQDAIERDPRNPQAHYSLGVVYSKMKDPQAAILQYAKALELSPDFGEALFNLASSYDALGDFDKAVAHYQRFLGLPSQQDELVQYAATRLKEIHAKAHPALSQ